MPPLHDGLATKVYDFDKASFNDPMGECVIALRPLLNDVPWDDWVPVQPCEGAAEATGRIHVRASMSITAAEDNTLAGFRSVRPPARSRFTS